MSTSSETITFREPLSPIQVKGLDMVIKGVSKKFPFIIGWEKSEVFDKYQSQMFINLNIDMNKLSEYYNGGIKPYWINDLEIGRSDSSGGTFFLENHEEIADIARDHRRTIEKRINSLYQSLPKQFQVFVSWSGPSFLTRSDGQPYKSLSTIDIHTYNVKIY